MRRLIQVKPGPDQPVPRDAPSAPAIALAGLIALAIAMGVGRFAFTPLLPMMLQDAGLTVAEGAWLASANYLGHLIGALAAMRMHLRAVVVIRASLIAVGVFTLAVGFTHSFTVWLVLRLLAGVASCLVLVFMSAWALNKLAPLQRPLLGGTVFTGVGAGIAAAGGVCLVAMANGISSAHTWIALGVASFFLTAAIWPIVRGDDAQATSDTAAASDAQAITTGAFHWDADRIRLVVCYGMYGFGYIIPATFLPVMAKQAIHDPTLFGLAWPAFGIAAALSTLGAALALRFTGNRRLWLLCHLVMAPGVAVPAFWPGIGGIVLAAIFVGGTFVVVTMVAMQEARDVAGPQAKNLIAAMTGAFGVGQIIGPVCAGFLAGAGGGFSGALLIAAFLLLASALALYRKPSRLNSIDAA